MTTSRTRIEFHVIGRPQQRGSKTPWIPRDKGGEPVRKNGRIMIATMDSNKKSKAWMQSVRDAAHEAMDGAELLRGPVCLDANFHFARPKSHYGTGRNASAVKNSAPTEHVQAPDLSKLVRAIEDAMTGVVYIDDRQICRYGHIRKGWTTSNEGCWVNVHELDH